QNLVVAGFCADIDEREAKACELAQLFDRFLGDVSRQAIARHAPNGRQFAPNRLEHGREATNGERHRVTVGEEDALDGIAKSFPAAADAFQQLRFVARPEALLRRGVHLAECAAIPGATVSDWQDQRLRFTRRAKDGFDIANGNDAHGAAPSSGWRKSRVYREPSERRRRRRAPGAL